MSLFSRASDLNNRAVVALIEGDDEFAIKSMADAIKLLKQELAKPGRVAFEDVKCTAAGPVLKTVEIPDLCSGDDHHEIFNQAIHVPCSGEESQIDIHVYSAAVIFNLGLAHHRQALKGNKEYQGKAVKLYNMVLRVLDDTLIEFRTAVMIKLATINNLAQIQFAHGDFDEAREGLSHLAGFIALASGEVLSEPQVRGLLMNVLMIRAPKVAPAA
jgi:tetratricopeptide (TPR) repeat protein